VEASSLALGSTLVYDLPCLPPRCLIEHTPRDSPCHGHSCCDSCPPNTRCSRTNSCPRKDICSSGAPNMAATRMTTAVVFHRTVRAPTATGARSGTLVLRHHAAFLQIGFPQQVFVAVHIMHPQPGLVTPLRLLHCRLRRLFPGKGHFRSGSPLHTSYSYSSRSGLR